MIRVEYIHRRGFTIVELLIVVVVIAILATISTVAYNGIQQRASVTVTKDALRKAERAIVVETIETGAQPGVLPVSLSSQGDVQIEYHPTGGRYSGLSPVQNGVLFQALCEELIQDPQYSQIHPRDGGAPNTVVMRCNDNISHNSLLITGWDSMTWTTPITRATLQSYIDSVPYDDWFTDRQDVVRGFYTALITQFEARGGQWPITSFWDYYNPYGVPKEELPPLDTSGEGAGYCLEGFHRRYQQGRYHITSGDSTIQTGPCE